jgi:DNA-binding ferritin-like protein
MNATDFAKKFKPYMKKGKAKGTVEKPITQEYKEVSIDVAEELENFAQDQSNIQSIQETFGEMTDEEADDAFVEAVKQCKTK